MRGEVFGTDSGCLCHLNIFSPVAWRPQTLVWCTTCWSFVFPSATPLWCLRVYCTHQEWPPLQASTTRTCSVQEKAKHVTDNHENPIDK